MGLLVSLMIPNTPTPTHSHVWWSHSPVFTQLAPAGRWIGHPEGQKRAEGLGWHEYNLSSTVHQPANGLDFLSLSFPHTNWEYQQASRDVQKARGIATEYPGRRRHRRDRGPFFLPPRQILENTVGYLHRHNRLEFVNICQYSYLARPWTGEIRKDSATWLSSAMSPGLETLVLGFVSHSQIKSGHCVQVDFSCVSVFLEIRWKHFFKKLCQDRCEKHRFFF